jgi:hypothetical protein
MSLLVEPCGDWEAEHCSVMLDLIPCDPITLLTKLLIPGQIGTLF